jgi:hypothetical protein
MSQLTMRDRRQLLCHYLQQLDKGVGNYSISDWAVNHLLLELLKLGDLDRSVFEVVNDLEDFKPSLSVSTIKEELERERVFN